MEKHITFDVEEHMTGQTVEKVLRTALGLTKRQISRAKFQADGIRKNGVQCRTTDIVQTSDQIIICIEAAKNDLNHLVSFCGDAHPLEILYEDEDILAVDKPAGMPVHPSILHYRDTLANFFSYHMQVQGIEATFRPINRLDRDTMGLCLAAKNALAARKAVREVRKGVYGNRLRNFAGRIRRDRRADRPGRREPVEAYCEAGWTAQCDPLLGAGTDGALYYREDPAVDRTHAPNKGPFFPSWVSAGRGWALRRKYQ